MAARGHRGLDRRRLQAGAHGSERGQTMNDTSINRVLARLQDVRKTDKGWEASCPAHDGQPPILKISVAGDGTVIPECPSPGCNADAICKAMGLTLYDLFPSWGDLFPSGKGVPE
jgi:hypothetical protein